MGLAGKQTNEMKNGGKVDEKKMEMAGVGVVPNQREILKWGNERNKYIQINFRTNNTTINHAYTQAHCLITYTLISLSINPNRYTISYFIISFPIKLLLTTPLRWTQLCVFPKFTLPAVDVHIFFQDTVKWRLLAFVL